MADEHLEHSGLIFTGDKLLKPCEFMHDEYLEFLVKDLAKKLLEPLREEVYKRIYKDIKHFVELKRLLPDTSSDVYRNYPSIDVRINYTGDSMDVFRNNLAVVIRFE